jgi:hypothetical protein
MLMYKLECNDTLYRHFMGNRGVSYAQIMAELDRRDKANLETVGAMIDASRKETVRLIVGATNGIQGRQSKELFKRADGHDQGIATVNANVMDTKDIVDLRTIKVILEDHNIQTDRHFSNRCSISLRDYCSFRGIKTARSLESGRHMFPVAAVSPWLQDLGNDLIKNRVGEQKTKDARRKKDQPGTTPKGQTVLDFPSGRKV